MKPHHQELLDAVLQVIETEYAQDISILFIYGSCVNKSANNNSDLDMIFVPKTQKGRKLARTFIYKGCGNDLWGVGWERVEQFASFDDPRASVIAESQLVYYATQEDRQRYEALKERVYDIENGKLTPEFTRKAEMHLIKAKQYFGELCLEGDLTCAGGILYEISDVICLLNHTYLRFGTKRMGEELSAFKRLPQGFPDAFNAVSRISNRKQAKDSCRALINLVSDFLTQLKKETLTPMPFSDLAGLYEEISAHWNKIYSSCEQNNAETALLAVASLQHSLNNVQSRLGISVDALQFINSFDANSLNQFAVSARKAQQAFVALLESNGVPIVQLDSLAELKAFLAK